jgi:cytochrome P450
MITGYKEAEFVSKNQEIFTSEQGVRPKEDTIIGLIDEAEPRHGAMRGMINRGFSPRMVKKLELVFRSLAVEALDEIASKGECDFVESYGVPLPIRLIAKMLGIRDEDRDRFHQWSDDLIASDGNHDNAEIMARSAQAFMEYSTYVTEVIEDRRKSPQDDLISILVGAKDSGFLDKEFTDRRNLRPDQEADDEYLAMANDELIILLVVLMVAGNETTRNGIAGGMQLLIENPEARQRLLDDPSLIPSAVEEMVRLVSPVRTFRRTLTRDYEWKGRKMKEGDEVCIVYPAANRDPRTFDDPDTFRVDRNPQHLGFGIGSHFCLGANLARLELRVIFRMLAERVEEIELAGDFERARSSFLGGVKRMPIRYRLRPA